MAYPTDSLTKAQLDEAALFLEQECPFIRHIDLVIQLGSGCRLDTLLDDTWSTFSLQKLPHMPHQASTAKHNLQAHWGTVGQVRTLLLSGRYHAYEGHGRRPILLPIWTAMRFGTRRVILVNAAGAINPAYQPGDLMLIADHINGLGVSALAGMQCLLPDPFVDMTHTYDRNGNADLLALAQRRDIRLHEGVYQANPGPQFETPAEIRMAGIMGADVVGMSTVLEATVAHALGARVTGISIITNMAAGLSPSPITHEEHIAVGSTAALQLNALLKSWITSGHANLR